jgi:hypothetical protein
LKIDNDIEMLDSMSKQIFISTIGSISTGMSVYNQLRGSPNTRY